MTELDPAAAAALEQQSERGNQQLEAGDWRGAVETWTAAWRALPEPREQWEASLWLHASIADAYWTGGDYEMTIRAAQQALMSPGGTGNPFPWFRQGQAQYELGQQRDALNSLTSAYMLAGKEIFADEDPKYLALLRANLEGFPD